MPKLNLTFETSLFDPQDPSEGQGEKLFLNNTFITLTTDTKASELQKLPPKKNPTFDEIDKQLVEIFHILEFNNDEHAMRIAAVHAALDAIGFTFHRS